MPNEFVDLNQKNIRIWFLLAFQAGAVNAGGFIACHRFVTHTTGFATHFGFEFANGHEGMAIGMLSVPLFFLIGAMITSYFVDLPLSHGKPANYRMPSLLIFVCISATMLLGQLGLFGLFGDVMIFHHDYFFLVLLCLASGLQNALITNSSGVVVRTTHLTGVTTDLGVGLVRTLFGERRRDPTRILHDRNATIARAGIIGSFILGSATSAYLFIRADYLGFLVPVFTSLLLLRYFVVRTQQKEISMRILSVIGAFFLFSAQAFAAPERAPPESGKYVFNGEFDVGAKIHYEVVYAMNDAGRAKLADLRKQSYECWYKYRDTWLCKQFQSTEGTANIIRARVTKELEGSDLELGERFGEPGLISKGTDVAEYLVIQNATVYGKTYKDYRLVMTQGFWSIRMGEPTEVQFSLAEDGQLSKYVSFAVTESKTAYTVYSVMAAFRRM